MSRSMSLSKHPQTLIQHVYDHKIRRDNVALNVAFVTYIIRCVAKSSKNARQINLFADY